MTPPCSTSVSAQRKYPLQRQQHQQPGEKKKKKKKTQQKKSQLVGCSEEVGDCVLFPTFQKGNCSFIKRTESGPGKEEKGESGGGGDSPRPEALPVALAALTKNSQIRRRKSQKKKKKKKKENGADDNDFQRAINSNLRLQECCPWKQKKKSNYLRTLVDLNIVWLFYSFDWLIFCKYCKL